MIPGVRSIFRKKGEEEPPKATESTQSEWVSIRTMMMRVLRAFPEARAAVVEGLFELGGRAVPDRNPAWATRAWGGRASGEAPVPFPFSHSLLQPPTPNSQLPP